jgi:hypothetical protein
MAVLALVPGLAAAGAKTANADWSTVQALTAKDRVQVRLVTGASLKGVVDHVTPVALYVTGHDGTQEIRRQDIRRIELKKSGHALAWALVGLAGGAAAGGGIGSATMEREPGRDAAVGAMTGLCAVIGGGIGYLAGRGHSVVIYDVAAAGD